MRIGFDFDKVFINYPPFLPYFLVDFLYKGTSVFRKTTASTASLHYRFPGFIEQRIRIFSHYPLFRSLINDNIEALKKLTMGKNKKTYLVSSRFSFLKKRTDAILEKYKLHSYFDDIYFNYENQQPHVFKEQTIKKLKLDTYIDDDLQLSLYLSKKIPTLTIYWITGGKTKSHMLPRNVIAVKDLRELENYIH
ncbi:MAG: hypothetical protein Q7T54_06035 [Candidatus Levybacteria bacterium]|nr:hypothetical protein [Candidatus Levybacteria bacterium]